MENQSEVARLRARVDLEVEALQHIKNGFAKVADHETIMYHYRILDDCYKMNELLAFVDRKSQLGNSWSGYAVLLRYLDQARRRLPTLEELEHCDIDTLLTTELEHLAVMLVDIFPTEGYEELYSYLLTAQT